MKKLLDLFLNSFVNVVYFSVSIVLFSFILGIVWQILWIRYLKF
jgi:hypothetical protein